MRRMVRVFGAMLLAAAVSLCVPAALAGPQESPGAKSTSDPTDPPTATADYIDNSTDLTAEVVTNLLYYVP